MPSRQPAAPRPYAGLFVVSLGVSLATMDVAVNVAFPAITAAFELNPRAIRWIVVAYVVTYACLMLAFGRLGDAIGHRRVFRAGLAVALGGYLGCALAPDYLWLLIARIVQGISTALLLSCAPALVTQLFADAKRTHALGMHSALTAIAATIAPVLGGVFIAWLGWSGVFLMRLPIVVVGLAMLPWLPRDTQVTRGADHYSLVLLALAIAGLLLAPSLLGADGSMLASGLLLMAGLGCLVGFVLQQRRAVVPFFPHGVIRDTDTLLLHIANVVLQFAAFAIPLIVPYYLARIVDLGPEGIGAMLSLLPIGTLLGASTAARCVRGLGTRTSALGAVLCLSLGTLAISYWSIAPPAALVFGALLLNGFGLGLFQVVYTDVVVANLPHTARGVAGSLTMVTRTIGVVTAASALTAALATFEAQHLIEGSTARGAYVSAFSQLFLLLALLPALVFAVSCWRTRLFRQPEYSRTSNHLNC